MDPPSIIFALKLSGDGPGYEVKVYTLFIEKESVILLNTLKCLSQDTGTR